MYFDTVSSVWIVHKFVSRLDIFYSFVAVRNGVQVAFLSICFSRLLRHEQFSVGLFSSFPDTTQLYTGIHISVPTAVKSSVVPTIRVDKAEGSLVLSRTVGSALMATTLL